MRCMALERVFPAGDPWIRSGSCKSLGQPPPVGIHLQQTAATPTANVKYGSKGIKSQKRCEGTYGMNDEDNEGQDFPLVNPAGYFLTSFHGLVEMAMRNRDKFVASIAQGGQGQTAH